MLSSFSEHTRCPQSIVRRAAERNGTQDRRWFSDDLGWDSASSSSRPPVNDRLPAFIQGFLGSEADCPLPSNLNEMIDNLRFERYIDNGLQGNNGARSTARKIYYSLRPLFPVAFRKHLQRIALKGWDKRAFPAWPVDFTVDDIFERTFHYLARTLDLSEVPFIWYWPDGHSACCVMTHDVETKAGRDFCGTIMEMESRYGLNSSFELVPEQRYDVPRGLINQITGNGCEVCVHGLNHDGNLFSSEAVFLERAKKINQHAEEWAAIGFRSPVLYRNLDWFYALKFSYDMSVPNVGHLDPQSGGCCTVMPYFIGNILELPLTTTQDYPLYHILRQRSLDLWKEQTGKILKRHGLVSFIIHPDYTTAHWARHLYQSLLEYLAGLRADRGLWIALPREVDAWWRDRRNMELTHENGQWCIRGAQAERARVAYASFENGQTVYKVEMVNTSNHGEYIAQP
jgi:hypothetical protein